MAHQVLITLSMVNQQVGKGGSITLSVGEGKTGAGGDVIINAGVSSTSDYIGGGSDVYKW